jgi:hypothetical protein
MPDRPGHNHPDVETLAAYAAGSTLDEPTRIHVEACPICRLEIKKLERFARLDADEALSKEADWQSARPRLERAFRDRILPGVSATFRTRGRFASWRSPWVRWLAPAAAAALVLIVVYQADRSRRPVVDRGPVRGTPVESPNIDLKQPIGEIDEAPRVFVWVSREKEDYYKLEVFTSGLEKIFEADHILETRWAATDSVRSLLDRQTIYLWNVTGHRGVERMTVSPNGWFKITGGDH